MSVFKVGSNKSSQNQYPSVRPTLDLDFANTKALDPRITFTRASGGSYVGADGLIKYAGVNEARFDHDPYTGESLGLLVEESRTNNVSYSQNFSTYWNLNYSSYRSTLQNSSTLTPDGNSFSTKLVSGVPGGNFSLIRITISGITIGIKYTSSIFVKYCGEVEEVALVNINANSGDSETIFNIKNGTISANGAQNTSNITRYANDWYRISVTATAIDLGAPYYFWLKKDNGVSLNTGILIWGAQLEAGAFPTSYIPTEGSSRTRAADVASITGANFSSWYNQGQGSIIVASNRNATDSPPFSAWSFNNDISAFIYQTRGLFRGGGLGNIPGGDISGSRRQAYAYTDQASVTGVSNGNTPLTASAPSSVVGVSLRIGGYEGYYLNGTISRITYYPVRLPDAQLQALTR